MRRGPAAALALTAVLVMAGCAKPPGLENPPTGPSGTPSPTGGPTEGPAPTVGPITMFQQLSFFSCQGPLVHVSMPLGALQDALPDGYTAAPDPDDPVGGTGIARYLWAACANVTHRDSELGPNTYGHVAIGIEPPANATAPSWYILRMLSSDEGLHEVWTTAGFDTYNASMVQEDGASTAPGTYQSALGDYAFAGLATIPQPGTEQAVTLHAETANGTLVWTGTEAPAGQDAFGGLTLAPDDPLADIGGPHRMEHRVLRDASFIDNLLLLYS